MDHTLGWAKISRLSDFRSYFTWILSPLWVKSSSPLPLKTCSKEEEEGSSPASFKYFVAVVSTTNLSHRRLPTRSFSSNSRVNQIYGHLPTSQQQPKRRRRLEGSHPHSSKPTRRRTSLFEVDQMRHHLYDTAWGALVQLSNRQQKLWLTSTSSKS